VLRVNGQVVRYADGPHRQILTTRLGLQLPEGLAYEIWARAGVQVFRLYDSSAWCLGDWLVYGQDWYTDRYQRAVHDAGLDYQTLRNYAWVARAFSLSRRRDKLSFGHHAEVAALSPAEQDRWLDDAEEHGWSRNVLRKHLRPGQQGTDATDATPLPRLVVTHARLQAWQEAAARSRTTFEQFVFASLDRAAAHVLRGGEGRTGQPPR
jgi:hypothetical protein